MNTLFRNVIAAVIVAATLGAECYMLVRGSPTNLDSVVMGRVLGTLDAALILVIGFYFGSSAGSARKSEVMAASAAVTSAAVANVVGDRIAEYDKTKEVHSL